MGEFYIKRKPKIGDIVCHYIYTRSEWMALVLAVDCDNLLARDSKTLVKMIPGVKLEGYFEGLNTSGWIYTKWIWTLNGATKNVEIFKTNYDREQ